MQDAQLCRALPDLLSEIGLPHATFNHPRIALYRLDATLKNWGLL
jgi:serine/threonine-protein kinase HipA